MALPALAGVRHEFVDVDGVRLHVAEAGTGPPVVCLHGWPQNWWTYRHLLTELSDTYRVICPDWRGYGWSDVPRGGYEKEQLASDLIGLMDALGLDRVRLVGHDWGGVAGFLACLRAPERFERYLALNTGHPFSAPSVRGTLSLWRFAYQPLMAAPVAGPRLARTVMPRAVVWLGARGAWSDRDREIYLAPFRDPARARAASLTYRTFLARELGPLLRGRYRDQRLRVPTLFVHGADDVAITPHLVRGAEAHADDYRLELVPGVGHFITDEVPQLVLDRARSFFA